MKHSVTGFIMSACVKYTEKSKPNNTPNICIAKYIHIKK